MYASLNCVGNTPVDSNKFTIFVIMGRRMSKHLMSISVGTGSSAEDLAGDLTMSFRTSSSDTGAKLPNE